MSWKYLGRRSIGGWFYPTRTQGAQQGGDLSTAKNKAVTAWVLGLVAFLVLNLFTSHNLIESLYQMYRMVEYAWMVSTSIRVSARAALLENFVKSSQWSPCCTHRLRLANTTTARMESASSPRVPTIICASAHLAILVYIYIMSFAYWLSVHRTLFVLVVAKN